MIETITERMIEIDTDRYREIKKGRESVREIKWESHRDKDRQIKNTERQMEAYEDRDKRERFRERER